VSIPFEIVADVLRAAQLASVAHDGQTRKGSGHPYVVHPLRVSERLTSGCQEFPPEADLRTILLAAVLHDILEDTQVPKARLVELFGEKVSGVVEELTQDLSLPKIERRQKMIDGCKHYSLEARIVKLADRWDNMSEMSNMGPEFISRYCTEATAMIKNMEGSWPHAENAIAQLIKTHTQSDS
jgi:guanosine-3',5'-bis(diphosphate) 3'-pyrophosphohydrolase